MKPTVIDLFAGVGGLSLGFEQAGFHVVLANEYDNEIATAYRQNHHETKMVVGDITALDLENTFGTFAGKIDVIIGGPPCQGFSQKGQRKTIHDERNFLFKYYVKVVDLVRPRYFVMENVPNLLTAENGYFQKEIIDLFNGMGYSLNTGVLNAADYGVPQNRRRAVIIGKRDGKAPALPIKTEQRVTIWDAIGDLAYGVLKAVKANDTQKDLTDLLDEDIEIADVEVGENEYLYVFTFVGVITIEGRVLKCYPKYLLDATAPKAELKQVLKVLEKYNSKEQIIRMYNDTSDSSAFNMLAVMLFLLQDYFEYGAYTNTQDIIESNGSGDILWDKTINETFTLLSNNRPYYPELLTMKRVNDDFDFFKRLHECILTRCTEELRDADLLDLFDIMGVDISDEHIEDFGDKEYVLERIVKELNVQFNTRKQLLLKTLYAYIANSSALDDLDCFSMFGTNSFNLVWEKVCAEVMDNQLQKPIGGLRLPVPLTEQYRDMRHKKLIDLIDKPQWSGTAPNGEAFVKQAEDTLIPDLISIVNVDGDYQFIIFDAKYYNIQLEHNKKLRGQPGIESITKQYLYQLAYQPFVEAHQISTVKNCFLMPTASTEIIEKGTASLAMLHNLGLQDIQVRLLPAEMMYRHYIENTKMDIRVLNL